MRIAYGFHMLDIHEDTKYYPAIVALEVTLRCNMRCLHCGSSAVGKTRDNELALHEWITVVDQLADLKSEFVTLSGGEPFLWPHWRELASHITQKGMALSMISNGYHISKDDVAFLKEKNLRNIALSLDGTKKTHDHIRQTNGSFDKVMRSISLFKEAGIKVGVSTSVNQLNFSELGEIKTILNDAGIDVWQVQVVNSFGRAGESKDKIMLEHKQYKELIPFIHNAQKEQASGKMKMRTMPADSIGYCHSTAINVWSDLEWNGCNAGRYVIGIWSNGDVTGCLSLQHKNFMAGNVRQRKLKEIWEDDEAFFYTRKFKADQLCGSCKDCTAGAQCKSGCLGMGYSVTGELYNNPYCYKHIVENERV
jgi:radical SAM protein with 4Fe4S-binding SPASM domain